VTTPWMLVQPAGLPVRFESIGWALPARRLGTAELMASTRHHPAIDLERLTGIRERRVCGDGEDTVTLAVAAARDCLARSHLRAVDLDMVISASITRHDRAASYRLEPSLALTIAGAIGARDARHLDVSNACAGMLTGVFLLVDMIRRGAIRSGMVVSGEHITGLGTNAARSIRSILSPQLASLTLGDAGAAVIVARATADQPGILLAGFTTLAEHSRLCLGLPARHAPGATMYTRARKIHDVAMADTPPLIEQVLERAQLGLSEIDWLVPHQTSVRALRSGERVLAERLGEHPGHLVVTVDELGNTASTTLFLALHRCLDEGRFRRGDKVMLVSVASGLQVGIVIFVVDELKETHAGAH
jgi:3-oxoacyl-[acyl-carrier-protein] synthase III